MKDSDKLYIVALIKGENVNYEISFRKKDNNHIKNFEKILPQTGQKIELIFKDLKTEVHMGVDQKCLSSPIDKKGYKKGIPIKLTQKELIKSLSLKENDKILFNVTQKGQVFHYIKNAKENGQIYLNNINENKINDLADKGLNAEEILFEESENLFEGAKKTVIVNAYERSSKAKKHCKEYWGTTCYICEFDFEKVYGQIGKGFIHVHHLVPVSKIGESYQIDPINDMKPVCPNCHAMLHMKNPPLTIEELNEIINASR